jgi:hypothetical protein
MTHLFDWFISTSARSDFSETFRADQTGRSIAPPKFAPCCHSGMWTEHGVIGNNQLCNPCCRNYGFLSQLSLLRRYSPLGLRGADEQLCRLE